MRRSGDRPLTRRRAALVAALVVALAWAGSAYGMDVRAAPPAAKRHVLRTGLSASPTAVASGGKVRLSGSGWPCGRPVRLAAFVPGVSPYGAVRIGSARPRHGRFSKPWRAPRVTDGLDWTIQATQRCGRRTVIRQADVDIAAGAGARATALDLFTPLAASGASAIDQAALQMIADHEGFRLDRQGRYVVYNDPLGYCTAGYGHLLHKSRCTAEDRNGPYNHLTPAQAVALLQQDADRFAAHVIGKVNRPLTQTQLDTLVDFVFNCGTGAFDHSQLLRVINRGQLDQVPHQLARWVHGTDERGRKVIVPGLVTRRQQEADVFTHGVFPPVQHPLPTTTSAPSTGGIPSTGGNQSVGGNQSTGNNQPTAPPPNYTVTAPVNDRTATSSDGRNLGTANGQVSLTYNGLTVSCPPTPHPCGGGDGVQVPAGTQVTLSVTYTPQSYFVGWSGPDCPAQANPCTFTIESNVQDTANLGVATYLLKVSNPDLQEGQVLSSDNAVRCGGAESHCTEQEVANDPLHLEFTGLTVGGKHYKVTSVSGCAVPETLPASSAECEVTGSSNDDDQTVSVTWG